MARVACQGPIPHTEPPVVAALGADSAAAPGLVDVMSACKQHTFFRRLSAILAVCNEPQGPGQEWSDPITQLNLAPEACACLHIERIGCAQL